MWVRLNGTDGAQTCLWSQRVGDPAGEPSRFPEPKCVGQMPSTPLSLLPCWGSPPSCLSCSPLASLLCPEDQQSLDGASGGVGPGPRTRQISPANWEMFSTFLPSEPQKVPPGVGTTAPSQPPLRGACSVQLPLLLPPQSPHVLPVHLGVPPISLGIKFPHQHPAGTLAVGRCELCVFPGHHLDSAPNLILKPNDSEV